MKSELFTFFLVISINRFHCQDANWIAMDPSKSLPSNCVIGGIEISENFKGPLYIGRKQVDDELVIGKVIDAWKSGYFPKNGEEHWSDHYELFCTSKYSWISKEADQKNAIAGGKAGNGEPFYVCRGNFNGQQTPGKFYKPTGCCYICFYGKEHCVQDYSILSSSSNNGQSFVHKESISIFYSNP